MLTSLEKELFNTDPAIFLDKAIKSYVTNSPRNLFPAFPGEHIWDEPLVGFADGDDSLFQEYKKIIGEFHVTPREALETHLHEAYTDEGKQIRHVTVIAWILPSTRETRLSLRRETEVPSLRWNHTRWWGQDLNFKTERYIVALLESLGYHAVAPDLERYFEVKALPNGRASNWSLRHAAYAAGLGTFSLSDGFITPKGIAIRVGSVVCNLPVSPTPRPYQSYTANCLFYRNGSCKRCAARCPAGAISEKGHDKNRCFEFLQKGQREAMKRLGRGEGYVGRYLGCGLCQTKVPCESGIPKLGSDKDEMALE